MFLVHATITESPESEPSESASGTMSSKWTSLAKCPVARFSNIVFISSDEFVIAPYHYSKQKADGILKYTTKKNKWSVLVKYPKDFEISNCSLSFDETSNTLYLIGAESTVYTISLETKKMKPLPNGHVEVGVNCKSLFCDGTLHIIGGSRNRHHLCRQILDGNNEHKEHDDDEKGGSNDSNSENGFRSLFEFEDWAKGIQNCGLVHVRSKRQFILFGGYNQYSDHKYCDLVYVLNLGEGDKAKWVKKCKMPERACYFGYVLSSDERYIVVIGGYTTNKKLVKKIYVLDVAAMKFIKSSTISSPASGSVRAAMGDDATIYLFKHDNGSMWKINIQNLVKEYSSNEDNYAYHLVKKYKKLLKTAEQENRQSLIQIKKLQLQNDQLRLKKGGGGGGDHDGGKKGVDDKKRVKRVDELEQQIVDQQTEIRRVSEKVSKQMAYINQLEAERMKSNNTNLKQRMEIKKLKQRLRELEGDVEQLDNIESFLAKQEKVGLMQDAAIEKVLTPTSQ